MINDPCSYISEESPSALSGQGVIRDLGVQDFWYLPALVTTLALLSEGSPIAKGPTTMSWERIDRNFRDFYGASLG